MKLVVMLLWVGASNGGPGVIPGFESMGACHASEPTVVADYAGLGLGSEVLTRCVTLPAALSGEAPAKP